MKDTDICKLLNLSNSTLYYWKKAPADDWRAIIYNFFALKAVEELTPEIERIKKILEARAKNGTPS